MHGVYVSQLRLPSPSTIGLLLRDGEPVTVTPTSGCSPVTSC